MNISNDLLKDIIANRLPFHVVVEDSDVIITIFGFKLIQIQNGGDDKLMVSNLSDTIGPEWYTKWFSRSRTLHLSDPCLFIKLYSMSVASMLMSSLLAFVFAAALTILFVMLFTFNIIYITYIPLLLRRVFCYFIKITGRWSFLTNIN